MTEAQPAQTTEINDGLHRTNVAVFGLDRPGIVAVVSNALTRRGVNLEQVNQMALHGQFALMCVIQKPIQPYRSGRNVGDREHPARAGSGRPNHLL